MPPAQQQQQQQTVALVPFTAAAHEHTEPFPQSFTVTPGATAQTFETVVPSYGYLRSVFLEVILTGGVAGTMVTDAPFSLLDSITILDTNGAPIYGPLDGYSTYWANASGGYAFQNSVKNSPWYSGSTPNFKFGLRVPIEITHDTGLGSLANQNAAAAYKLRFTVNPISSTWSTAPTTVPTMTITPLLEAWTLPNEVDGLGRPQEQVPPNHGTLQYWSSNRVSVNTGNNFTQVTRMGNLIRDLVFIGRANDNSRNDGVLPNPMILSWDARQLNNESQNYRSQVMWERMLGVTRDPGVFAYGFNHFPGNKVGNDNPTGWLPTVQATRMELDGVSNTAGTIQTIVNDVAPVALDQSNRYVETSGSGFHPNPDIG